MSVSRLNKLTHKISQGNENSSMTKSSSHKSGSASNNIGLDTDIGVGLMGINNNNNFTHHRHSSKKTTFNNLIPDIKLKLYQDKTFEELIKMRINKQNKRFIENNILYIMKHNTSHDDHFIRIINDYETNNDTKEKYKKLNFNAILVLYLFFKKYGPFVGTIFDKYNEFDYNLFLILLRLVKNIIYRNYHLSDLSYVNEIIINQKIKKKIKSNIEVLEIKKNINLMIKLDFNIDLILKFCFDNEKVKKATDYKKILNNSKYDGYIEYMVNTKNTEKDIQSNINLVNLLKNNFNLFLEDNNLVDFSRQYTKHQIDKVIPFWNNVLSIKFQRECRKAQAKSKTQPSSFKYNDKKHNLTITKKKNRNRIEIRYNF